MLFANSTLIKINSVLKGLCVFGLFSLPLTLFAQFNSPYSRYGLGDLVPANNMTTRGMGGVSTAYADRISVNFNNPASYSRFFATKSRTSNKLENARVIFDAGVHLESRTLVAPNTPQSFTGTEMIFSYIQVGIPLRRNWGLAFGIRPISRIGYKINQNERLIDGTTGEKLDSAITQFNGSGGGFLPTVGMGYAIGGFSIGANMGYMFGNRETDTRRAFLNDTVHFYSSQQRRTYSYGDIYFNSGMQYQFSLKNYTSVRLGVAGNWQQTINGTKDALTQTYVTGPAGEPIQVDSVYGEDNIEGEILYPAQISAGIMLEKNKPNGSGWSLGLDFSKGNWSEYRFFGTKDSVQNNFMLNAGGSFYPKPTKAYFSRVTYRFGVFTGEDYVKVDGKELPIFGASFGMALPIRLSRQAPNQINYVNLAFEFIKKGDEQSSLKENLFRFSVGFNFTDLWFMKRRYD